MEVAFVDELLVSLGLVLLLPEMVLGELELELGEEGATRGLGAAVDDAGREEP